MQTTFVVQFIAIECDYSCPVLSLMGPYDFHVTLRNKSLNLDTCCACPIRLLIIGQYWAGGRAHGQRRGGAGAAPVARAAHRAVLQHQVRRLSYASNACGGG